MKFSIHRDLLLSALQKTQSVVEKKNTVQILSNILCSVQDQQLSISATDLEVGIKIALPLETGSDGKVTIPAKQLLDIVKELPSKTIQVQKKENHWVEIVCGKSKFNVVSLSAESFPPLPLFEEKNYTAAKSSALKGMIDRTAFAVSTDATRYHLNGVFFEPLENNLFRMTACDGHRLSFEDQEVFQKTMDLKRGIIIPRKGLMELRKVLDEVGETIDLSFEKGNLFARSPGIFLSVRLIEGEYPNYRMAIPQTVDRLVHIHREELNSALKRVALLANEKSKSVKLSFQTQNLIITSSNPDKGEAREELPIEYQGDPIEIGFNAEYLLDYLSVIDVGVLDFQFKDKMSSGILRESGKQHHTYVVMPMRV
jgi:DNA polymerase-3 subunit beta